MLYDVKPSDVSRQERRLAATKAELEHALELYGPDSQAVHQLKAKAAAQQSSLDRMRLSLKKRTSGQIGVETSQRRRVVLASLAPACICG